MTHGSIVSLEKSPLKGSPRRALLSRWRDTRVSQRRNSGVRRRQFVYWWMLFRQHDETLYWRILSRDQVPRSLTVTRTTAEIGLRSVSNHSKISAVEPVSRVNVCVYVCSREFIFILQTETASRREFTVTVKEDDSALAYSRHRRRSPQNRGVHSTLSA